MANINVTVTDGNNITLALTPPTTQIVTLDRGIAGPPGVGVASGGTTGQVLSKFSNNNYDTFWQSLGTLAAQNADNILVSGGAINNTSIGAITPTNGSFTTLIGGAVSANYAQLTGGATTKAVQFQTLGLDTNSSLAIQSKGTGAIDLVAGSSGVNISNGGTVTAITRTAAGTSYITAPSVAISVPTTINGVQAIATGTIATTSGSTINFGGTGYTLNDVLTVNGGTFTTAATFTVSAVSGGVITAITIVQGGVYTSLPTNPVVTTGGTGTGATINLSAGVINSTFIITNAGSGYIEQPTVSFSGGGGSGAAAYATVGAGTIVRSLGSTIDFYMPSGQAFRVSDGLATATPVSWIDIRTNGTTANIGVGGTSAPLIVNTNSGIFSIRSGVMGTVSLEQFRVSNTASAVNYLQVTGSATSNSPVISVQGSDTNITFQYQSKGTGQHVFSTRGSVQQFRILDTASSVNYGAVTGAAIGAAPAFSVAGTDSNIDLALIAKGTGVIQFGSYTGTILTPTGYINIKDSGGTVRRLLVG